MPPCEMLTFTATCIQARVSGAVAVSTKQDYCTVTLPCMSFDSRAAASAASYARMSACSFPIKNSTNGVFVNDIKIMEQALAHGDVVQFGGAADILVGARFDGSGSHIRCISCFFRWRCPPSRVGTEWKAHSSFSLPFALFLALNLRSVLVARVRS